MNIQQLLKTRYSIIKQFLFISKINLMKTKNENLKKLLDDGFVHIKNGFPKEIIKEILDRNHDRINNININSIGSATPIA